MPVLCLRWLLRLVPLLVIAPAALLLDDGGAVDAQDGLPPVPVVRDLSIEISADSISEITMYVYNHSTIPMRNVKVRLTTEPPAALAYLTTESRFGPKVVYDASSGILTIPEVSVAQLGDVQPVGRSLAYGYAFSRVIDDIPIGWIAGVLQTIEIVKVRAEIIDSVPAESSTHLDNNQAEFWVNFAPSLNYHVRSNTAISVDVVNRSPAQGENYAFRVNAVPDTTRDDKTVNVDADVVVKVSLSDGLAFASGQHATTGTTFSRTSATTGLWRLGSGERVTGELNVLVRLSTDAGAAPPLNRRCLTAQIVGGRPTPHPRLGGLHTACLGADIQSPAATTISDPLRQVGLRYAECAVSNLCREGETDETSPFYVVHHSATEPDYYRPEDVAFLVDPTPLATPFMIGGTTYPWATGHVLSGRTDDDEFPGMRLYRLVPLKADAKSRRFTISDVTPKQRAGAIAIVDRYTENNAVELYEALNPDKSGKLVDSIDDAWPSQYFPLVVFSETGLYKVNLGIEYTRKSDDVEVSNAGVLTFVVGEYGDLQVHDAGLHGTLPKGQRAYTLRAENNQDGTAEQVEVALTGVPRGAKAVVSSDGGRYAPGPCDGYGLCEGIWKIGDLESRDERYITGRSDGPTLTLLVEGRPGSITATITNTKSVTARGKTYTYKMVDLDESNSKDVSVAAGTGRGERDPEVPGSLRVARLGSTALLRWEPVETVNRWPVAYYEVERDGQVLGVQVRVVDLQGKAPLYLDLQAQNSEYRVRAVSDQGVHGPWSERTAREEIERAPAADPVQPPDSVTGLTADAGDGYVDLEWRAGSSAGRRDVWHQLWRSDDQTWRDIAPRVVGSSHLGYTVTELENGTEYIFRVRAVTQSEYYGDLVPGVSSGPVLATPTATLGQQSPGIGQTQPLGPNTPPEFDRATAWADYCVNGGVRRNTEVARVTAYDYDGDSLEFFRRGGFDEIADTYFRVDTVQVGDTYWGVIYLSRTIPRGLAPEDDYIIIDLEVSDGRGGIDQIGVVIQYDPDGGCP